MKKSILNCKIVEKVEFDNTDTFLFKLNSNLFANSSDFLPGQFVELMVPGGTCFLRRPISICDIDPINKTMTLLISRVGPGTIDIGKMNVGDILNMIVPLGNGFPLTMKSPQEKVLLVGGGVGIAPILYLARKFKEQGVIPHILLGGRTKDFLFLQKDFENFGKVHLTTNDGSEGTKGFVTDHQIWIEESFSRCFVCGPTPMMEAVAKRCDANNIECFVSLENKMACGIGACLCCVQDTHSEGNLCVCTDGPVFNAKDVKW